MPSAPALSQLVHRLEQERQDENMLNEQQLAQDRPLFTNQPLGTAQTATVPSDEAY